MDLLSAAVGEGDMLTSPESVSRPRCQRSACHERMVKVARKPRLASSAGMIRGLIPSSVRPVCDGLLAAPACNGRVKREGYGPPL